MQNNMTLTEFTGERGRKEEEGKAEGGNGEGRREMRKEKWGRRWRKRGGEENDTTK